jgi:hypothetical protein
MSTGLAAALAGLGGLAAGTFLSETIKGFLAVVFRRSEQRAQQAPQMRSVVMDVDPFVDAYFYDFEELRVLGFRAKVTLTNHSQQLVKNILVTMHRRPEGIDSARMLAALASNQSVSVTVSHDLGLDEDQPFEEMDGDWLDFYWFEANFEDTHGHRWRLYYNPRDRRQTVERVTA